MSKKKYGTLFEQFNDFLTKEWEDASKHGECFKDYVEYESDIETLKEKDGYKLVFVDTPAHGYFGYVYKNGKLIVVGEEDEGLIYNPKIMDFFKVDQYGRGLKEYEIPEYPKNDNEEENNKWLDLVFSPLFDYLDENYTEKGKMEVIPYMMFMGHTDSEGNEESFLYKNKITRQYVMFDKYGRKYYHAEKALYPLEKDEELDALLNSVDANSEEK